MTPGRAALVEAARLESARVYGRVCREHRQERPAERRASTAPLTGHVEPDADIASAVRAGLTTTEIVEAYCTDYGTVRRVRKQVMAKGAA